MGAPFEIRVSNFSGIKNDRGEKFAPPDTFYEINNFNYDDIVGANKVLMPSLSHDFGDTNDIDGIFEYQYLNSSNRNVKESIGVHNGTIYKNWDTGSPTAIYSGLTAGRCEFALLDNKLFITNGKDYTKIYDGTVVYDMGAPKASNSGIAGSPDGTYYYAITFVTAGGEEVVGSVSNTIYVNTSKITLAIPIGYAGVTSRKIYRTETGGSDLKLVATVANNTDLTYLDNVADGALTTAIPAVNNALPKPYFINVNYGRLIGAVTDINTSQAWASDSGVYMWDNANYSEVSGIGNDNSALVGMRADYSKIIIGSRNDVYVLDASTDVPTVTRTRSNLGFFSGYSAINVPSFDAFPGGIMFISNQLNDVRLFDGNFSQPIATSLDNLKTQNWSQGISSTFTGDVKAASTVYSVFYDFKVHFIIDAKIYVFDIKKAVWTTYSIETDSYSATVNVAGVFNNDLYFGLVDSSRIEQAYSSTTYRTENYKAIFKSPCLAVAQDIRGNEIPSDIYKFFTELYIYYISSSFQNIIVRIVIDGDTENTIEETVRLSGGPYTSSHFSSDFFETSEENEDYRVLYINKYGREMYFEIESEDGMFFYRGYQLKGYSSENKERRVV